MKFFLDTANLDELKKGAAWGIVDGVTTNPSLIAKEGRRLRVGVLGCGPIAQAAHFESCTKARNADLYATRPLWTPQSMPAGMRSAARRADSYRSERSRKAREGGRWLPELRSSSL